MDMTLKQGKGRGGKRGGLRGRITVEVTLGDGMVLAPLPKDATAEQKNERKLALARERARRHHALRRGNIEKAKVVVGLGRDYADDGLRLQIEEVKESNEDSKLMPKPMLNRAIKYKQDEARRLKNVIIQPGRVWANNKERSDAITAFLKTAEGKAMTQSDVAKKYGCVQSTVSKLWAKIQRA